MIPTGREAGNDVRGAYVMAPIEATGAARPCEPAGAAAAREPAGAIQPTEPMAAPTAAPGGGPGSDPSGGPSSGPGGGPVGGPDDSATQGTAPAPSEAEPRDPRLPRRVPQPSQLRGQAAITPAQPAEQTLRHLRDVLDRLP
ncbi:hypothetical protein ABH920_003985 [Catenulispora sp. EB89]|uniref:hypothetical protein n=1 Tax=Catenulispora sp. EB89 TaxID=3156257 RepID=UPI0035187BC4